MYDITDGCENDDKTFLMIIILFCQMVLSKVTKIKKCLYVCVRVQVAISTSGWISGGGAETYQVSKYPHLCCSVRVRVRACFSNVEIFFLCFYSSVEQLNLYLSCSPPLAVVKQLHTVSELCLN